MSSPSRFSYKDITAIYRFLKHLYITIQIGHSFLTVYEFRFLHSHQSTWGLLTHDPTLHSFSSVFLIPTMTKT